MKVFVDHLDRRVTEQELKDLFSQFGEVIGITIPTDRDTGMQRGFAFVEMSTDDEAENAINELNGFSFQGHTLVAKEAEVSSNQYGRGGRGGRGGYDGRGGGGGGNRDRR